MTLFELLKPAAYQKEIENADEIKKSYRYWRIRIFYSMYIGYAFYYLTRKSFTFAMPAMVETLGFSKADLGILGSVLYLTYGVSKFLSGIISDKSNPRYFMSIGLILTGVCNILFGFSSSIYAFAIFWGLNGWFQGFGWPPCAKLLTHWYSQSERGTWWGFWNTCHNVGGALIPLITAMVCQGFGWRFSMFFPGIACILAGLFLLNRLRDTPQSLGLPSIERYHSCGNFIPTTEEGDTLTTKEILFTYVIKNYYIWILAIAYFFIYIIRTAVNDWGYFFLYEHKQYSLLQAGIGICAFEIGGFVGSLAAGWLSDNLFKGKRAPINVLFSLFVLIMLLSFWYIPPSWFYLDMGVMFLIGFFIFGPQMLIGVAAAELSHKKAAGTATGFAGCFAYGGAAVASLFGKIAQDFGWYGFLIALAACAAIAALLLLPLWPLRTNPKYSRASEDT